MDRAAVERVLEIAREMETAGRRTDAEVLAQLAAEVQEVREELVPDVSRDELDSRLTAAEADITAGRLTSNEDVWTSIDAARRDSRSHRQS
jgi:hypothetical protein